MIVTEAATAGTMKRRTDLLCHKIWRYKTVVTAVADTMTNCEALEHHSVDEKGKDRIRIRI